MEAGRQAAHGTASAVASLPIVAAAVQRVSVGGAADAEPLAVGGAAGGAAQLQQSGGGTAAEAAPVGTRAAAEAAAMRQGSGNAAVQQQQPGRQESRSSRAGSSGGGHGGVALKRPKGPKKVTWGNDEVHPEDLAKAFNPYTGMRLGSGHKGSRAGSRGSSGSQGRGGSGAGGGGGGKPRRQSGSGQRRGGAASANGNREPAVAAQQDVESLPRHMRPHKGAAEAGSADSQQRRLLRFMQA